MRIALTLSKLKAPGFVAGKSVKRCEHDEEEDAELLMYDISSRHRYGLVHPRYRKPAGLPPKTRKL